MFNWLYADISLFILSAILIACGFFFATKHPHWTLLTLAASSCFIIIGIISEVMRII